MADSAYTLDHKLGIEVPRGTDSPLINNVALFQGLGGIAYLAGETRIIEIAFVQANPDAKGHLFSWPAVPPYLASMFHWFSLSVVNHLRLVALVQLLTERGWRSSDLADPEKGKDIRLRCAVFVQEAAPELYYWRNKVAAHFAATDPRCSDSSDLLRQSIWTPVTYSYPVFRVGHVRPYAMPDADALPIWSLTETFTKLAPRFWPDKILLPVP